MVTASGIESWLTERVSVEEAEKAAAPKADQLAQNSKMASKLFESDNQRWQTLKSQMVEGDERWYFSSPQEMWRALAGRAGIALVRDGKVVETIIFLMN